MKLIEAEAVKAYLKRAVFGADQKIDAWVDAMPEADAAPVVHARWVPEDGAPTVLRCSCCGKMVFKNVLGIDFTGKFCMHCGAKMDAAEG